MADSATDLRAEDPGAEDPRAAQVAGLFDRNAARYDCVNSVICFGQDAGWRRWTAARALAAARASEAATPARSAPATPPRILDACGGTGLVALELARLGARVTLADVSDGMLAVARARAVRRGPAQPGRHLELVHADLSAQPAAELPGAPFAAATVAFGLRYLADPAAVLRNLAAALRPGGAVVILEAVVPPAGPVSGLAGAYFFHVAPRVASALAGRRELYDELTGTVRAFGTDGELAALVRAAGLAPAEVHTFAAGIVVGVVARPAT